MEYRKLKNKVKLGQHVKTVKKFLEHVFAVNECNSIIFESNKFNRATKMLIFLKTINCSR